MFDARMHACTHARTHVSTHMRTHTYTHIHRCTICTYSNHGPPHHSHRLVARPSIALGGGPHNSVTGVTPQGRYEIGKEMQWKATLVPRRHAKRKRRAKRGAANTVVASHSHNHHDASVDESTAMYVRTHGMIFSLDVSRTHACTYARTHDPRHRHCATVCGLASSRSKNLE